MGCALQPLWTLRRWGRAAQPWVCPGQRDVRMAPARRPFARVLPSWAGVRCTGGSGPGRPPPRASPRGGSATLEIERARVLPDAGRLRRANAVETGPAAPEHGTIHGPPQQRPADDQAAAASTSLAPGDPATALSAITARGSLSSLVMTGQAAHTAPSSDRASRALPRMSLAGWATSAATRSSNSGEQDPPLQAPPPLRAQTQGSSTAGGPTYIRDHLRLGLSLR